MVETAFASFCPPFPDGFWDPDNKLCYCTVDAKELYPEYCHVNCARIIEGHKPANGRCQCLDNLGGPFCNRTVCYYTPSKYYDEKYYQLFCLDNYDYNSTDPVSDLIRPDNCSGIINLGDRKPRSFPMCPCLNGNRDYEEMGNTTCVCSKGYYGELCQYDITYKRPSPFPTIAVVCVIMAIFVIIGLALWYRKKQRQKLYSKMYQLEPIAPGTAGTFGQEMQQSVRVNTGQQRKRRATLANLFSSKRRGKKSQAKGPTIFEGAEGQSQQEQPPGAYEEQFGTAPQNYSMSFGTG